MSQCPTCNKEIQWQDNPYRPFCSERCKLVDLGKWVNEEFRVPGKPAADEAAQKDQAEAEDLDS
jgi:endogenous inhibitor of DNA gyrase (YacG/DUF329 family)